MKAVIFDMDGIIFDSEKAEYSLWCELADKYGLQDLDKMYFNCIGTNYDATKGLFLDFYGEDFPFDRYKKEVSENYHKKYDGGKLPLKTGVRELLQFLKENRYFIAIASSTRSAVVRQQIEDAGLMLYFDRIVGGEMVSKSKPEPDIFLKAAEGLTIDKKDIVVIEDSFNGIRAACTAGLFSIMVPDMIEPDEEMQDKADVILPDLLSVMEYLRGAK